MILPPKKRPFSPSRAVLYCIPKQKKGQCYFQTVKWVRIHKMNPNPTHTHRGWILSSLEHVHTSLRHFGSLKLYKHSHCLCFWNCQIAVWYNFYIKNLRFQRKRRRRKSRAVSGRDAVGHKRVGLYHMIYKWKQGGHQRRWKVKQQVLHQGAISPAAILYAPFFFLKKS